SLRELQQRPPRRLRQLRKDLPEDLDNLVARMLERNPAHRPPLAATIMDALASFSGPRPVLGLSAPLWGQAGGPTGMNARPKARALIVDDESDVRLLHRFLLQSLNCDCVEAADGTRALEVASTEGFDLVLLDLRLPDLDGYEVCRRLREDGKRPHLKI